MHVLLQASVVRLYLVGSVRAGRRDKVHQWLEDYGEEVLAGPDATSWQLWFALPHMKAPATDPRFQAWRPLSGRHCWTPFCSEWGHARLASTHSLHKATMPMTPIHGRCTILLR